ncbi:hypothetical protein TEA_013025 [Camellia sinensis var. sinensis]|uniref:Uncharacterized protein n=1 Tax=Camellia sinensis var. sinensis TaxID=542762 RepID=A0A4S4CXI3_CAMSN|nr:hypothetical protein TEA_013025 [Camellia sinensis var. sinensis]
MLPPTSPVLLLQWRHRRRISEPVHPSPLVSCVLFYQCLLLFDFSVLYIQCPIRDLVGLYFAFKGCDFLGLNGRGMIHLIVNVYLWCIACALLVVYLGLSYGLYVLDWKFELLSSTSMPPTNESFVYTEHLFNSLSLDMQNSLTAAVTCIIGLQYGHILGQLQDHKELLYNWCIFSFSFLGIGLFLALVGISLNKPLYTISYMLVMSASAGITFSALYILVRSKQ